MKAKKVYEFHKTGDPLSALNLGMEKELERVANMYAYKTYKTDDYELCSLLYYLGVYAVGNTKNAPLFRNLMLYIINNEKYRSRLEHANLTSSEKLYMSTIFWYDMSSFFIKCNFDKSQIKWALDLAKNEDIEDLGRGNKDTILEYLLSDFLSK